MSFPAYEHSNDSGWPWIGELPSHWDVRRLKTLFSRVTRPVEDGDKIVTAFRDGQVTLRENRREEGFTNALQEIGYQGVRRGDLVIHAMDGFAGAIGVSDSDGKSTPVYTVCVAEPDASARYYALLLRHMALSGFVASLAKGIRERSTDFRWADASVLALPHPPLNEQVGILAFLDRETAKIDALVEAQRRLIELLKEKRQAVISHAVTKGLDPSAPMKDSGVEWLGQVPAHWEVTSIKHAIDLATSGPRGWSDMLGDEGAAFFQSQNIGRVMDVLLEDGARINPPDDAEAERARLRTDDVVVCITGGRTGAVAHVQALPVDAYINQHVCLLRPRRAQAEGRYLAYCLFSSTGQEQLSPVMYGLKQGLGLDQVRSQTVTLPPLNEQRRIVRRLDESLTEFSGLMASAEAAIALLQERRAALISAAVTGKIDVRGCAVSVQEADAA